MPVFIKDKKISNKLALSEDKNAPGKSRKQRFRKHIADVLSCKHLCSGYTAFLNMEEFVKCGAFHVFLLPFTYGTSSMPHSKGNRLRMSREFYSQGKKLLKKGKLLNSTFCLHGEKTLGKKGRLKYYNPRQKITHGIFHEIQWFLN